MNYGAFRSSYFIVEITEFNNFLIEMKVTSFSYYYLTFYISSKIHINPSNSTFSWHISFIS